MILPPRPVDVPLMRAGRPAAPSERSQPVPVLSRFLVHETLAVRALPVPASLPLVAETLDAVRAELRAAGRSASDASLAVDGQGQIAVGYVLDAQDVR